MPTLEIIVTLCPQKGIFNTQAHFPIILTVVLIKHPLFLDLAISASPSDHLHVRLSISPAYCLFLVLLEVINLILKWFLITRVVNSVSATLESSIFWMTGGVLCTVGSPLRRAESSIVKATKTGSPNNRHNCIFLAKIMFSSFLGTLLDEPESWMNEYG